jgi:hypothetical protein
VVPIAKRYAELKAALPVDLERIDTELAQVAQPVQQCAELAADANNEEQATKMALDVITAETSAVLRNAEEGKKALSEAAITSMLPMQEAVQIARVNFDDAKYWSSLCTALQNSMRTKASSVHKACDMTIAGWITPSSYSLRRAEMIKEKAKG